MKIYFQTLGCKVNQYETQAMEQMFSERGWEIAAAPEECDACVINTCAVTAESERKSRQAVRHIKSRCPEAVIAVCGCSSQISPDVHERLGADVVFGSGDRKKLVQSIEEAASARTHIVNVDKALSRREYEILPAGGLEGRTRAMLKIQDGCSNFCSYCIIPYTRGPSRSMPIEEIRRETERLVGEGYREIVVTGIEIASYGRDLKDGSTLADAVCTAAESAGDTRIRLGSLEPRVVTEDFCRRLAACGNVCPHFHLSLQSGCDETLMRMRRKYDTERFYESVCLLREHFRGCGIAADLITGFPGETEEEFSKTLSFIEKCAFSSMHIFPYSVRPGTKAADMEGQLSKAEKSARAARASKVAERMTKEFMEKCVGTVQRVLFETEHDGYSFGHAGNYCRTAVKGSNLRGTVADVRIMSYQDDVLLGNILL